MNAYLFERHLREGKHKLPHSEFEREPLRSISSVEAMMVLFVLVMNIYVTNKNFIPKIVICLHRNQESVEIMTLIEFFG